MSKGGKSRDRTRTRSPEHRRRTPEWTERTIQAILDAAPSEAARNVLIQNPSMMKALIRKASRHTDDDGAVDVAILKRILAEDDSGSTSMREAIREREDRLKAEMRRAEEAEARYLEAQARLNALIIEKAREKSVAEQAREEAKLIKLKLDMVGRDIERRNEEMKRLEEDYDRLEAAATKIKTENQKLRLREAREKGKAEGRAEGRTYGVREGARRAWDEGYGEGYELGSRETMERIQKGAAMQLSQDADEEPLPLDEPAYEEHPQEPPYDAVESSGDTMAPPVTAAYHNVGNSGVQRSNSARERERLAQRQQQQLQAQANAQSYSPGGSDDESIRMPEPEGYVHPHQQQQQPPSRSRSPAYTRPRQTSSPRNVATNGWGHPTEAEQVRDDYRASPDRIHPIPVHNAPSPRPHAVNDPLPDIFVPSLDESGKFTLPPPHEWEKTPATSVRDLQPSPRSNRDAPLPGTSSFRATAAAPKTPKAMTTSLRSQNRDSSEADQRRSPTQSTPLSQYSILQPEEQPPNPPSLHHYRARNNSALSVIQEGSDYESPITGRVGTMSPSRGGNPYPAPFIPNVNYDEPSRNGSSLIGDPANHSPLIPPNAHSMAMPEPTPGQPRLRQYEEEAERGPSPVNIPNVPYVVAPDAPGGITTYGNIGRSSTGGSKSSKKGKKSKRTQSIEVPEITINPPSDQSESVRRLSEIEVQPQAQPSPRMSPRVMPITKTPMVRPGKLMDSDSEDSGAERSRPQPSAPPRMPSPKAFVPVLPDEPVAHEPPSVPFIPPAPPIIAPPPPPAFTPAPAPEPRMTKAQARKAAKKALKTKGMPVPEPAPPPSAPLSAQVTGTGEVVSEPPPNAKISYMPPGTMVTPVVPNVALQYEAAPIPPAPPITYEVAGSAPRPAYEAAPMPSYEPAPFAPPRISPVRSQSPFIPPAPASRSPRGRGRNVVIPEPEPEMMMPEPEPELEPIMPEPEPVIPVIPAPPSPVVPPINNVVPSGPRAFVPPMDLDPMPGGWSGFGGDDTGGSKKGKKGKKAKAKAGLGRPGAGSNTAYSLTSRTPRMTSSMANGPDGLPTFTPSVAPVHELPPVIPSPRVAPSMFPERSAPQWVPPQARVESVTASPFVPPIAMMPQTHSPLGRPHSPLSRPAPQQALNTSAPHSPLYDYATPAEGDPTEDELAESIEPPSPPVVVVPVSQPLKQNIKAFIPPTTVSGANRMPRPRADRTPNPLANRRVQPTSTTPIMPVLPPVMPQADINEHTPVIPPGMGMRPRSNSGGARRPDTKGILKAPKAYPDPTGPTSPFVPTRPRYDQPTGQMHNYARTPGPQQPISLGTSPGPSRGQPLGAGDPWQNAPEDFFPPAKGFPTPKTSVSVFDKDFKTPHSIFQPIEDDDQSSIYDPDAAMGQNYLSATPAHSHSNLPSWGGGGSSYTSNPSNPGAFIPPGVGGSQRKAEQQPRPHERARTNEWSYVYQQPTGGSYMQRPRGNLDVGKTPRSVAVSIEDVTDEDEPQAPPSRYGSSRR